MRGILRTAIVLGVCAANACLAQRVDSLAVGTRLRVRPAAQTPWEYGYFHAVVSDSIELTSFTGQTSRRFALGDIKRVEAYDWNEGARTRQAAIGALAGLLVGAAALVVDVKHCEANNRHSDGPSCGLGYVVMPIAMLGGAGVGTIVGALWPVRHWRRVSIVTTSG